MRRACALLMACAAVVTTTAWACGYCIEDRMAAVYDHAVLTRARTSGHKVAFYAVLGPAPTGEAASSAIRREVEAVRGVDRSSARYSGDLAALSFAYDPRAAAWADIDKRIGKALAGHGVTPGLISIVDRPDQVRAGNRTAAR